MANFKAVLHAWKVGFPVDNSPGEHLSTHGDDMTICMAIGALGAAVCLVFHMVFGLDQSLQTSVESNADMVTFGLKTACETMFVLPGCWKEVKGSLDAICGANWVDL